MRMTPPTRALTHGDAAPPAGSWPANTAVLELPVVLPRVQRGMELTPGTRPFIGRTVPQGFTKSPALEPLHSQVTAHPSEVHTHSARTRTDAQVATGTRCSTTILIPPVVANGPVRIA